MPTSTPCPKCQATLSIPDPLPERMQCPTCGAVLRFKAPAPPKSSPSVELPPAPTPAPAPESPKPAASTPVEPAKPSEAAAGEPPVKKPKPRSEPVAAATGILSWLHAVIPKPIVFGFYGALGGLLFALVFGELFMLFNPTPQTIKPLTVSLPEQVTVFPGSLNRFKVQIKRYTFEGPVQVTAEDLPVQLSIPEVIIPADKEDAEIEVTAQDDAKKLAPKVTLRFAAVDQPKLSVTDKVQIYLEPTPPKLTIAASRTVTVYVGGQNTFEFAVARSRFDGPVRAELLDLPKGVFCPLVTLQEKEMKGKMTVAVTKDAVVNEKTKRAKHTLKLEVHSLEDHTISDYLDTFQLNVEPPPEKLLVAAPGQVTVFPGTRNKFTVRIARDNLKGPVQIEVTGAPRGVSFTSPTIPEDKAEAEIEIGADTSAKLGLAPDLRVNATFSKDIYTSVPMELHVKLPPPAIQVAVSPKVPVYPGGKATFGVKIVRARFSGPVTIGPANTPFLSIDKVVIPADSSEATMEVIAREEALQQVNKVLPMPLQVIGQEIPKDKKEKAKSAFTTATVNVEVLAPPSDLQISVPAEVELYQAGRCLFSVAAARGGFVGPVEFKFDNVPPGVTLPAGTIPGLPAGGKIKSNSQVTRGVATLAVPPKTYEVQVTATGPKAPDGKVPTATKKFNLVVKKFDPAIRPPLDIVFVLDVTQSLDPQIAGVRDGIGSFLKGLKDRDLDARVGLIGFRDINETDFPAFEKLMFNGQLFTTDAKVFAAEVGKLKAQGGGDPPESSLDAIVKAAKEYPFRPEAKKVFLLITDEKPQTKGNSVTLKIAQDTLREKKIDQLHLLVKDKDKGSYTPLQTVSPGGYFDFDAATGPKGKENFAAILPSVSNTILTTIGAPEPTAKDPPAPTSATVPAAPPVEQTPAPKAEAVPTSPTPEVPQPPQAGKVQTLPSAEPEPPVAQEAIAPPASAAGVPALQSTAVYSEGDRNRLLLIIGLWTAALAAGISLLLVGAQKRYLSQSWPTIMEIVKALLSGGAAGLFAGLFVQGLFTLSTSGSSLWVGVSRVAAWVILGGLIGGAMSFFVPNLKWTRALIGGCIGGFIGVIGFMLVGVLANLALGSFLPAWLVDIFARLIGAVLLGLFIGVMVAMAEYASRRYWLEVSFGERETRTVTLGSATVALGGDERLVGVYVPNAPPKALGFRIDRNRVFCEDFVNGTTTEATPGDSRSVANAKVRVCTAAEATPTGANLKVIVSRDVPLMVGMPLTADDIPGLSAQGADGIVALVSRRPNNPKIYLLRNRSKQAWTIRETDGKERKVDPGLSIELSQKCEIDFGQVKATLDPSKEG